MNHLVAWVLGRWSVVERLIRATVTVLLQPSVMLIIRSHALEQRFPFFMEGENAFSEVF